MLRCTFYAFAFYLFCLHSWTAGELYSIPSPQVHLYVKVFWCFLWILAAYGVATNEAVTTLSQGSHSYDLGSCTTYTYYDDITLGGVDITCSRFSCSLCMCSGHIVSYSPCFTGRVNYYKYFVLLVSLYWTCAVLSNVVHVTVAGAVAHWWQQGLPDAGGVLYGTAHRTSHTVVYHSLFRAVTRLFGPICLGSLLVAMLRATRSAIHITTQVFGYHPADANRGRSPSNRLKKFVWECLKTLLFVLDRLVTYFNHYAFCYVAIYEMSFVEASRYNYS
jgi:hypothetical protein